VRKHFYHTFRGKRYRIVTHSKSKLYDGYCQHPEHKNRTILVRTDFQKRKLIWLAIHEALHACFFDTSEEAVDEAAKDIAKFLQKLNLCQTSKKKSKS